MVRSSAGTKRKIPWLLDLGDLMLSLIVLLSQPMTPRQESSNSSVLSGWWSWVGWFVPTNAASFPAGMCSLCSLFVMPRKQKGCGHFPACGFNESFDSLVLLIPIQSWLWDTFWAEKLICVENLTMLQWHEPIIWVFLCFTSNLNTAAVLKG